MMGLYVAFKMPALIFITLACNGLLNGMLGLLLGSGLGFRQSLVAQLVSFTIAALVLGALAPVTFFMAFNAPSPDADNAITAHANFLVAHTILIAMAGIIANLHLAKLLIAVTPDTRTAVATLAAWLAGNAFVGAQLSWILRTPRTIPLVDVMKRDQTLIPATLDQEEVGNMFQKYALISAAVVDASGRLVGQMTVDDVVHIIAEEAGEDALLMSGAGEGDINEPIRAAYFSRVRWLVANLGTALIASLIIAAFGAAIEQLVALAVLMPIVASIGGNAGTQTMAVTVRAIAMNQLTRSNTKRILLREMRVAVLNGATVALLIGLATGAIFTPMLGLVIAAAMVINVIIAGLAGVLVPVIFDRLDTDPAVASSVFVTMITDSMGFFAFLGLAVVSGVVG